MANEISIGQSLQVLKNGATIQKSASASITLTGNYFMSGVQNVGTTDETIALGDIGTVGVVYFKNLDSTNFVTFGADGTNYHIKLKAGESALLRWNGAAVHAKADTAACKVEYVIVED
jgi:hypothetical protein